MEVIDSVILRQLNMKFEANLEKIFRQLELFRFSNKRGHRCGEWLWQFGNSDDNIMKVCRIVVICQLLKGHQHSVCFDRRRGVFTAELRLTGKTVLFILFSGRCLLQDEDHSASCPLSFPCFYSMRSGTSPERFRSGLEVAGSRGSHQDVLVRLVCGFLFC